MDPLTPSFCSRCGASLQADASFCHACGDRVRKLSVTPSEPAAGNVPPPPRQIQSARFNKPSFRTLSKPWNARRWVWVLPLCFAFVLKRSGYDVLAYVFVLFYFWLLFWIVFSRFKMPTRIVLSTACLILLVVFSFAVNSWFGWSPTRQSTASPSESPSDSWNALINNLKSRSSTPSPNEHNER
jgi:zinc-ribbon domain